MMSPAPPREIKILYWELFQTTEVWVRIVPEAHNGKPTLLSLIFFVTYPGKDLKRTPPTISLQAQPDPLTVFKRLSLKLTLQPGGFLDLAAPGRDFRYIYPCGVGEGCAPGAIVATLSWEELNRFAKCERFTGEVLGFDVSFAAADSDALRDFARKLNPR
jgi:hypothetical protein